jgi:hypothetical protein
MRWGALFSLDSAIQGASHWFPICCFVRRSTVSRSSPRGGQEVPNGRLYICAAKERARLTFAGPLIIGIGFLWSSTT